MDKLKVRNVFPALQRALAAEEEPLHGIALEAILDTYSTIEIRPKGQTGQKLLLSITKANETADI